MEGTHVEDTDGETMVLIIKLELEYEDEDSFVEPVSSVDEIESRSTNEFVLKANASNEFPLDSTSEFIKSETFSPTVNQNINMNGNKNISCSNCLKIFPNESSLLLHLDKEHPDFKCGPKVMFVDEVNQDDRIFDFIHKSRIKKEKLEQIVRTIQNHKKTESSGNKNLKFECSDSEGYPKVIFVDEVNRDDRIFDFIQKSRIKNGKLEQKLRKIQDQRKANSTGNKIMKIECSDWDGPKPFICNTCGTIFTTMSQLTSHEQKVHKKKKVHDCRYCAYTAKTHHVLKEHEKIHTNANPEVCKWCGKRFKAKKTLINHERLHTGETPYQCQFCEKVFVQKRNLNSHVRTYHISANIDSQAMSKVNLKQKAALISHLDKKPYICEGCQRPFRFKGNLKRHFKASCPTVSKENFM